MTEMDEEDGGETLTEDEVMEDEVNGFDYESKLQSSFLVWNLLKRSYLLQQWSLFQNKSLELDHIPITHGVFKLHPLLLQFVR